MNGSQLQHKAQAIELVTEQLSLGYAQQLVIKGLDLRFPAQQVTAIIGPNRCGKSTLLSGLARVLKPAAGQVLLNGRSIPYMSTMEGARMMALITQETHR